MLFATSAARADTLVYATASNNGASNSLLGTLDLTTGRFTQVASLGIDVNGLTAGPNGTLLAAASNGNLYTLAPGTGATIRFGSLSGLSDAFGLAPLSAGAGYYEVDYGGRADTYSISADGNTRTAVGSLHDAGGNLIGTSGTGIVADAANGTLYANGYSSSGVQTLYSVNPTNALATAIGSGLGDANNEPLTFGLAGGSLYGIDTSSYGASVGPAIYAINTAAGTATATGIRVSGLPGGYTLDTFEAMPTPLPKSATAGLALLGLLGTTKLVRRRRPVTA